MMTTRQKAELEKIQQKLGYKWKNRGLLRNALVHSSFTYESRVEGECNNERLEFLGDAVLQLVISEYLFRAFPERTEGELSKMRSMTVCEHSLARVARQLNLGRYILLGKGEEKSGGRERNSLLADAFEALVGSVYLDGGLGEAKSFVLDHLAGIIDEVVTGQTIRDYKTELQELLQRESPEPILYRIVKEEGPDHDKVFTAEVIYRGRKLGTGRGKSKKEAEQQAAGVAWNMLKSEQSTGG